MRWLSRWLIGISFITFSTSFAASPLKTVKIVPKGTTDISGIFEKTQISIKITTREVDIGKPSDPMPNRKLSNCTYSRYPCSVVDYVDISVNKKPLFVHKSIQADLTDLSEAGLREENNGRFVLTLIGGDASESYTADIVFDAYAVKQRIIMSNEAQAVMEIDNYFQAISDDN